MSTCHLGLCLQSLGRDAEGETLLREAFHASEQAHGSGHPDTQLCAAHLGTLLQDQGNGAFPDAELALKKLVEAAALLHCAYPPGHPHHARAVDCEGAAAGCRAYLEAQRAQQQPEPEPELR